MRKRQGGRDCWSDLAIYWAAVEIGEHDLLSMSFSVLRPRFERALCTTEQRADLPPIAPRTHRLRAPAQHTGSAIAEACLTQLLAVCAVSLNRKPNRDWAGKFVRQGEKVQANKLAIVKAALGIA